MRHPRAAVVGVIAFAATCLTGCIPLLPHGPATSAPAESPNRDGRSPAAYFKAGDCLKDSPQGGGAGATVVDCAKPHLAEVYAVLPLPDGNFPEGLDADTSKKKCGAVARTFVPPEEGLDPSMRTVVLFPDEAAWGIGARSITCFVVFDTARTGAFGAGRWTK